MASSANLHRVAKNTVILYFRMFFQMLVFLYTSRVVLNVLGETDFGIYDVTAGIVTILVFLNNSMAVASQRFITFALGRGDGKELSHVYTTSLIIHFCLALLVLFFGETLGVWYVENKLVVPPERAIETMMVFQCSLISAIVLIMFVPYMAIIIAYERMTAYAGITILDVLMKLGIVLSLKYCTQDRLVIYAVMLMFEAIFVRLLYFLYCRVSFPTIRLILHGLKTNLFRKMITFAGWSMFGNFALVCNTHGLNLVLNGVGGAIVNSARGIAFQIQTAIMAFISSFQTAINPQITKCYAQNDVPTMNSLILRSSKFSFMLMLFVAIPLMLETKTVLNLWLHKVPLHAVNFTRLLLCVSMVDCIANSMMIGAASTGKIKKYHIVIGCTLVMALPLACFFVYSLKRPVEYVFIAQLFVVILAQIIRQYLCRSLYNFSNRVFFKDVLKPLFIVSCLSLIGPLIAHIYMSETLLRLLVITLLSIVSICISVFMFGLTHGERNFVLSKITCR